MVTQTAPGISTTLIRNNWFEIDGFNTYDPGASIDGWRMSVASNYSGETATYDPLLTARAEYLAIGTTENPEFVSQTFATVPDQIYRFVYDDSSDSASGDQFQASWNAAVLMRPANTGPTDYAFTETAASTSAMIGFGGQANGTSFIRVGSIPVYARALHATGVR